MASFEINNIQREPWAKIKVIGTGGAGGNALNAMIAKNLTGVEFIAINTDKQDLDKSDANSIIQIGEQTTRGLGSGGNPEIAREAAVEDQSKIIAAIDGADMVFITAGMGGGTGTGSSPIIAEISKKAGALTVGVVTKPFKFEGTRRMQQAEKGIEELEKQVDTLIVIPNERLAQTQKISLSDAFKKPNEVLYQAVSGISDIITGTGYINVDFADVKTIMSENGPKALMGTGFAQGANRSTEAAKMAINSPLLEDISIDGAKGILLNVTASTDFGIDELEDACKYIRAKAHEDVNLIFGLVFDDNTDEATKESVRITVIATGIGSGIKRNIENMTNILSGEKEIEEIDLDNIEIPTFIRKKKLNK